MRRERDDARDLHANAERRYNAANAAKEEIEAQVQAVGQSTPLLTRRT